MMSTKKAVSDIRVSDKKIDEIRLHMATDPKLQKVMQYTDEVQVRVERVSQVP
jgi:hypothetical protein